LVPFEFDPDLLEDKKTNDSFTDKNSLRFYLNTKCTKKEQFLSVSSEELRKLKRNEYLENHNVLAGQMNWEPFGDQAERFKGQEPVVKFP
jgi:hypothetical protein